jgi:hypothetical protein
VENDAIARSAERAGFTEQPINFICECADESCFEAIVLTLEETGGGAQDVTP